MSHARAAETTRPDMSRLLAEGRALVEQAQAVVATAGIELILPQHEYVSGARSANSRLVAGVTQTLHRVGIIDDHWWTEEHAVRGTQVHALAAMTLSTDMETAFEVLTGPFESWGPYSDYGTSFYRWLEAKRPVTLATELLVYSPTHNYAGTLDWFGVLGDHLCVIDWKSGAEAPWHALQGAAYAAALTETSSVRIRRGTLYLHEDGRPATWRQHYKPSDAAIFQAALTVTRFMGTR